MRLGTAPGPIRLSVLPTTVGRADATKDTQRHSRPGLEWMSACSADQFPRAGGSIARSAAPGYITSTSSADARGFGGGFSRGGGVHFGALPQQFSASGAAARRARFHHRQHWHGHHRHGCAGTVRGSMVLALRRSPLRPMRPSRQAGRGALHLPDQGIHQGEPGGVHGSLHQGDGSSADGAAAAAEPGAAGPEPMPTKYRAASHRASRFRASDEPPSSRLSAPQHRSGLPVPASADPDGARENPGPPAGVLRVLAPRIAELYRVAFRH